jgi:PAS domain S-box-containing protein
MDNTPPVTSPKRPIALFCVVALLLAVGGYWFHRHEVQAIRTVKYNELKAITELKTDQVVAWRQEQLADIRSLSTGIVKLNLPLLLKTPGNASAQAAILERFRTFAKLQGYENMALAYPDGRLILALDPRLKTLDSPARRLVAQAVATHEPVFGDLVRSADSGQIFLDTVAPIFDANGQLLAVLLQRVDPARQLYPLIQSWPMPSKSAEIMLLGKEDSHVVFLNKLRHRSDPPLTIRVPLTDGNALSVKAVLGKTSGQVEGNDYRGVPVLADVRPVPESPWLMVAKVDRDEILGEAGYRGGFILLLVTMAILMTGVVTAFLVNDRRRHLYQDLYLAEQKSREALRESEERFRMLYERAPVPYQSLDDAGCILEVNETWLRTLGYAREEVLGRSVADFLTPAGAGKLKECLPAFLASGFVHDAELDFVAKNGEIVTVEVEGRIGRDADGTFRQSHCVLHNITDRKRTEAALQKAAIQWQTTFAAITDGIFLLDENQIIVDANQAMLTLFNKSAGEIIGRHCWEIVHDLEAPVAECPFTRLIKSRKRENMELTVAEKTFEIIVDPIFDKDGSVTGAVHIMRDITTHRNLEAQLRQSQKIEAVGTLAGGVAHDFNNILTAILGHAQIALMRTGAESPQRLNLEQIFAAATRAAALTRSLLAFSRKQVVNLTSVEVNDLLRRFDAFARRLIREDIALTTVCADEVLTVKADTSQLEQVMMNLVTNARDAMPQGGALTIAARRVELDETYITAHGYGKIGSYACISVSDTGAGMDEMTRQKIFEPFFTTKEVGKGTGLGLAMVYGIVKKHDGFINVDSEPAQGTTFTIYLPLYQGPALVTEVLQLESPLTGGTETILIAEDDEALRNLAQSILANFGYTVIEAVDGEDAVLKFREHRDRIKLVVLDGIMPKKNGKEAYLEIRSIQPNVKAVFVSGYAEDIFTRGGIPDKEALFIQKPIMPDDLIRTVRRVLDGPGRGIG